MTGNIAEMLFLEDMFSHLPGYTWCV